MKEPEASAGGGVVRQNASVGRTRAPKGDARDIPLGIPNANPLQ